MDVVIFTSKYFVFKFRVFRHMMLCLLLIVYQSSRGSCWLHPCSKISNYLDFNNYRTTSDVASYRERAESSTMPL